MALTRSDVLTIDSTVIAGVLILLTLSGLTVEKGIFDIGNSEADEVVWLDALKLYFIFFVVLSILPFAFSASFELKREMFLKRFEFNERLLDELKKAKENNSYRIEDEIQKRLYKNKHRDFSKPEDVVDNFLYKRDDATLKGIGTMALGFLYLIGTIGYFAFLRLAEAI